MKYDYVMKLFRGAFDDFHKKHLLKYDFYNMTSETKFNIARDTFMDVANFLAQIYPELVDSYRWFDKYQDGVIKYYIKRLS